MSLECAVAHKDIEVVKVRLRDGCDPNETRSSDKKATLLTALENGHIDIAKLFAGTKKNQYSNSNSTIILVIPSRSSSFADEAIIPRN